MISIIIMALLFVSLGIGVLIALVVWADNLDKNFERRRRHEDEQRYI